MGERAFKRAVSDEDKEARRRAILAASKRVFAERGFHATTIADVAREADLSYGSIYWYFDSKEALFRALMDSEQRALRRHVAQAVNQVAKDAPGDQREALRAGVKAILRFFEEDTAANRLLFRDAIALGAGIERHLYAIFERFVDDIEKMIVAGQEAGIVRPAPSRIVAFSVAGLIGQVAHRTAMVDDGFSSDEVADFVTSMIIDGLRPRPSARAVAVADDD